MRFGSLAHSPLPSVRRRRAAPQQDFGADYTDYAHSTARVLPYVW